MSFARSFLPELEKEMATTRRLLERVPTEKGRWKPHEKSFSLGHLAQLVATMPGWITGALREDFMDLAGGPGYSYQETDTLLEWFDRAVAGARAAVAETGDEGLGEPWSLRSGDHVIFTAPRGEVVRENLNHLIHHRGQLSVYLRLLDIPLPSIYGPTADEPWGG